MPTHEVPKTIDGDRGQRVRSRLAGTAYFTLFVVTVGFLAVGATSLRAMSSDVRSAKRQTEETARPANLTATVLVSTDCPRCYNVVSFVGGLAQSKRVKLTDVRTVDPAAAEGAALLTTYAIQRLPAFILNGEVPKLLQALPQLASYGKTQGGAFVGTKLPAPYVEVATGKVRGEFSAVYVTENQCRECYDPTLNRQALQQLGMVPLSEKKIDRSDPEGQRLVKQYAITTTPTVILTGDLAAYPGFDQVWNNIGTIEPDGAYVFRTGQDLMGTHYDLTTKKAVAPPKTSGVPDQIGDGSGSAGNTNTPTP